MSIILQDKENYHANGSIRRKGPPKTPVLSNSMKSVNNIVFKKNNDDTLPLGAKSSNFAIDSSKYITPKGKYLYAFLYSLVRCMMCPF